MLLTVNNLKVCYGAQTALDIQQPIAIEKGDRIGIIGSNGAGKTTFVKAILGLVNYKGSICTKLKTSDMAAHLQFNEYVNTMSVGHIMEAVLDTNIRSNQKLKDLIEYFDFASCLRKKIVLFPEVRSSVLRLFW